MAAVLGCGCLTWAAARKKRALFCGGAVMVAALVIALLTTQSRGGLIAFGVGLAVYLLLCLIKVRSRRAVGAALGAALFFGAILLLFGNEVFARFQSHEGGEVSNQTRLSMWHDAIGMWRDAPLLGHGLNSFASVFPLYQKIVLENQIALHPESSWLQWLTEIGLLPVLIGAAAVALFLARQWKPLFHRHRSFFLHAGGFAAFAVLIVHAAFDVPAHRWGTAGFALAALALACPMYLEGRRAQEPRQAAAIPLALAAFWCLPIFWFVPAWSPLCLNRLIELDALTPGLVQLAELERTLRYFPLNASLHQSAGLREVRLFGPNNSTIWQRHFAVASRLQPSVWETPMNQARACANIAPMQAVTYWQQAVERGGIHRDELLNSAVQESARFAAAQSAWGRYVEAHPSLLLAYAQLVPTERGPYYYNRWWKLRADAPDITPAELAKLYVLAPRWGHREDFEDWMKRHPSWGVRDYREWAALLHYWREDDRAWRILSIKTPEPSYPAAPLNVPRVTLESTWRMKPEDVVNAQQLALMRQRAGEQAESDEIILTVAAGEAPPPWFISKAAWILARAGRTAEAVDIVLRPR
jgi:hypothetical protein